jgi:hypothetical protein
MVVPERDTPGIRATHCTKRMITASFRLSEDSGRSRLPTRSAIHITAPSPRGHHHHDPQVPQGTRDRALG